MAIAAASKANGTIATNTATLPISAIKGGDTVECTKMNCPMQAGTTTDHCGDNCPWRTTLKDGDLISRAAAIDAIVFNSENRFAVDVLNDVPAVDAVPVVHGRWITDSDGLPACSVCDEIAMQKMFCDTLHGTWRYDVRLVKTPYCPKCGAKMDGEDEPEYHGDGTRAEDEDWDGEDAIDAQRKAVKWGETVQENG